MPPMKSRPEPPPRTKEDLLDESRLIWPEELAPYLGVPEGTLDQWASRGGGPEPTKVGRHRRYKGADVKAWLLANRRNTGGFPAITDPAA